MPQTPTQPKSKSSFLSEIDLKVLDVIGESEDTPEKKYKKAAQTVAPIPKPTPIPPDLEQKLTTSKKKLETATSTFKATKQQIDERVGEFLGASSTAPTGKSVDSKVAEFLSPELEANVTKITKPVAKGLPWLKKAAPVRPSGLPIPVGRTITAAQVPAVDSDDQAAAHFEVLKQANRTDVAGPLLERIKASGKWEVGADSFGNPYVKPLPGTESTLWEYQVRHLNKPFEPGRGIPKPAPPKLPERKITQAQREAGYLDPTPSIAEPEAIGAGLGAGVDFATRPFQYLSTLAAGTQRSIGTSLAAIAGDKNAARQMQNYGLLNVLDAAGERFYTGKLRPGYEQPVGKLYELAVREFGGDPESAIHQMILQTLDGLSDPTNYATVGGIAKQIGLLKEVPKVPFAKGPVRPGVVERLGMVEGVGRKLREPVAVEGAPATGAKPKVVVPRGEIGFGEVPGTVPEPVTAPPEVLKATITKPPQYAYRVRDVGEQGIPARETHPQAGTDEARVRGYMQSRGETQGKPQEIVRVDLSKLSPDDYEVRTSGGIENVLFKKGVAEDAVERVDVSTPPVEGVPEGAQAFPGNVAAPGRIKPSPLPGGELKPATEIILDLRKTLKTPIQRLKRIGRGVLGYYDPSSATTVVKYAGDLDTTAHELSHRLDDQFGLVGPWAYRPTSPFDAELIPQFSQYGSGGSTAPLTYQRAEGVAEWLRAYIVNPNEAKAAAPLFFRHFEATVPAETRTLINGFSNDIRKWIGLSPTERTISHIQIEPPTQSLLSKAKEALTDRGLPFETTWTDKLKAQMTDSLRPVMKAITTIRGMRNLGPILPEKDPEVLLRLYHGGMGKTNEIFKSGMIDSRGRTVTPGGANWLLEPLDASTPQALADDYKNVQALLVSQATLERAPRQTTPIPTGIGGGIYEDVQQAARTIMELRSDPVKYARLEAAASRYREWADAVLKYWVEKGRLSQGEYRAIRAKNQYYTAMNRIMDQLDPTYKMVTGKRIGTPKYPLKAAKGSARQIGNVYDNLLQQTHAMVQEADRNEALRSFTDLLDVKRPMYMGPPIELGHIGFKVAPGEEGAIKVWKDGGVQHWKFEPGVHQALKMWGEVDDPSVLMKILSIPARITRAGVVYSPGFMIRNVMRDAVNRGVISETGSKPWGVFSRLKPNELREWRLAGGSQAGHYLASKVDYHRVMADEMKKMTGQRDSIIGLPKKMWEGWKGLAEGSETIGRMDEYKSAYAKAKNELGYDDYNASLYAASQARGLIDYAISGTAIKKINQIVPFTNPAIQGLRRTVQGVARNPAGFMARWSVYVLTPTLLEYGYNEASGHGDEWRQLPAHQRDMFWNFKVDKDTWLRIPKPFEIGVLAAGVNRAIDQARGVTNAWQDYGGSLAKSVMPIDEGSIAGPFKGVVENIANWDFFKDRHIIPTWEEDIPVSERRGTTRASRIGQLVQSAVGADARLVDHFIETQLGGTGLLATEAADIGKPGSLDRLTNVGLGVLTNAPGSAAKDVKFVLEKAKSMRITGRSDIKDLTNHLKALGQESDRTVRDRMASEARDMAAEIRKGMEAPPETKEEKPGNIKRKGLEGLMFDYEKGDTERKAEIGPELERRMRVLQKAVDSGKASVSEAATLERLIRTLEGR